MDECLNTKPYLYVLGGRSAGAHGAGIGQPPLKKEVAGQPKAKQNGVAVENSANPCFFGLMNNQSTAVIS